MAVPTADKVPTVHARRDAAVGYQNVHVQALPDQSSHAWLPAQSACACTLIPVASNLQTHSISLQVPVCVDACYICMTVLACGCNLGLQDGGTLH